MTSSYRDGDDEAYALWCGGPEDGDDDALTDEAPPPRDTVPCGPPWHAEVFCEAPWAPTGEEVESWFV